MTILLKFPGGRGGGRRASARAFWEQTVRCRALGAGQDLKEFDVDNSYGLAALKRILDDCVGSTLHMEAVKVTEDSSHYRHSREGCILSSKSLMDHDNFKIDAAGTH